ncbi:MAG: S-layer homology domain-containing protein [Thermoleophilia bacterium]
MVLLIAVMCLVILPSPSASAESASLSAAASNSPVVPILFPLEERVPWTDTFGAPRAGGRTHAGNDLMVPKMTPLLAVVDGTVAWLNLTGKLSSYNNLPYYNILLRGDDGNDYFYVHLNNDTPGTDDGKGGVKYAYAPGLTNGKRVARGEVIGYAGDSGNAEDTGSHLHFEIHLGGYVSASGGQTRSPSAINPYPSLAAAPTLAELSGAGGSVSTTSTTRPVSTTSTTAAKSVTTTMVTRPTGASTTVGDSVLPGFSDVRTSDWFYADFARARTAGIVTADPDGRFRPYSCVSRALFTVYLIRTMAPVELASGGATQGPHTTAGTVFDDVDSFYWACDEIEAAYRLGLVQGTGDGSSFSPDTLITRAQMAAMISRALGADTSGSESFSGASRLYNDIPAGYWAQKSIMVVYTYGLMCGDTQDRFRPEENATRAQTITVMARLLRMLQGEAD